MDAKISYFSSFNKVLNPSIEIPSYVPAYDKQPAPSITPSEFSATYMPMALTTAQLNPGQTIAIQS